MPYQVKSGSITFVVASVRQALAMFDQMLEDARKSCRSATWTARRSTQLLRSFTDDKQGHQG